MRRFPRRAAAGGALLALLSLATVQTVNSSPEQAKSGAERQPEPNGLAAPELGDEAVGLVASERGVDPANLQVLAQSSSVLPLTQVGVVEHKVFDRSSRQVYGVTTDGNGARVDLQALQDAETAAYAAAYGTMTPQLAERVAATAPDALIEVGFWLKSNSSSVVQRSVDPNLRGMSAAAVADRAAAEEAANQELVAAAVAEVAAPFVADLSTQGVEVVYAARFSPAVFVRVSAGRVQALSNDPRVEKTYFTGDRVTDAQDVAKTTTAATRVWARSITGINVTGGVVECCDSLFEENTADFDAENNAYLARVHEIRPGACGGNHSHPTAVTGIMISTHNSFTGIAKDGRVVFDSACDGSQAGVVSAAEDVAAVVTGATNHSYGLNTGGAEPCPSSDGAGGIMERALDNLVRNAADSQYVAAGNAGNAACVGSPAIAWNVVSVGAFDDNNTSSWSGDTMATFSSGGDPGSNNGDRQEPEVAGPGVNFTGLLPSPGGTPTGSIGSGTSYAAPVYTAAALLASQRSPALLSWPEAERAVMIASACHNIEGTQVRSELDGAGGPDLLEMDNLLVANRFRFGTIANGTGLAFSQTFTGVITGQEIRVGLAWDTNTAYSLYGVDPSDDIDLVLKRPNGTVAATSSSFDNTHEAIEFVADQDGTWTIEVNRFRTSDPAGFTFYGLAWHRYSPSACTAP